MDQAVEVVAGSGPVQTAISKASMARSERSGQEVCQPTTIREHTSMMTTVIDLASRKVVGWALADWRLSTRPGPPFIEAGYSWRNASVESFTGRLRYEPFNVRQFSSVFEAQVLRRKVADRADYDPARSVLGMLGTASLVRSGREVQLTTASHNGWST